LNSLGESSWDSPYYIEKTNNPKEYKAHRIVNEKPLILGVLPRMGHIVEIKTNRTKGMEDEDRDKSA
jgi:hypothetical protein